MVKAIYWMNLALALVVGLFAIIPSGPAPLALATVAESPPEGEMVEVSDGRVTVVESLVLSSHKGRLLLMPVRDAEGGKQPVTLVALVPESKEFEKSIKMIAKYDSIPGPDELRVFNKQHADDLVITPTFTGRLNRAGPNIAKMFDDVGIEVHPDVMLIEAEARDKEPGRSRWNAVLLALVAAVVSHLVLKR